VTRAEYHDRLWDWVERFIGWQAAHRDGPNPGLVNNDMIEAEEHLSAFHDALYKEVFGDDES
jgi:hypothetical protein